MKILAISDLHGDLRLATKAAHDLRPDLLVATGAMPTRSARAIWKDFSISVRFSRRSATTIHWSFWHG